MKGRVGNHNISNDPPRTVSWFSCGAASAVATKMTNPDVIAFCQTNSEDEDNARFMRDCQGWFGRTITELSSDKYHDTWEVWEKRKYISGIKGAPCTRALKIDPRIAFQKDTDIHIFGYTADSSDIKRAKEFRENFPQLNIETPLIDKGITKAGCLAIIKNAGIEPPRVYEMGFKNANCIPCCKATSPNYWALVRSQFPEKFNRMSQLSKRFGAKLARLNGERIFINEIPDDWPQSEPLAPDCDFLCGIVEQEISEGS